MVVTIDPSRKRVAAATLSPVTMSPATTRTWTALGLAEFWFSVVFLPCAAASFYASSAVEEPEPGDIGLFASLVFFAGFALLVGIPIGVHTVGRLTDKLTRDWPTFKAALVHGVVGFALGLIFAVYITVQDLTNLPAGIVGFALPPALAAFLTHLVVPAAVKRKWISVLAWVLAAAPILTAAVWTLALAAENF